MAGEAPRRRIAVVGAGAIGSLFGAFLTLAGEEVWLVNPPGPHLEIIRQQGLRVVPAGGAAVMGGEPVRVVRPRVSSDPAEVGAVDLVLIAVKAYRTREAVRWALPLLGPGTAVLTLQNGLGNAEAIEEAVGAGRVVVGVTSHGAGRPEPGLVVHAGAGPTVIGPWRGAPPAFAGEVAAVLRRAGIEVEVVGAAGVERALWTKLAVNAAINGPGALLRVPNGALVESPSARRLLRSAAREVAAVAGRRGTPVLDPDPAARAEAVARATGPNRCSMLQDVERGRPTEVEAIYGAVVAEAGRLGVPVPTCADLYLLIRALEETRPRQGPEGLQAGGAPGTSA
ncbi:ketopantoate reductase family protein [Caldinitratiruptor microaerophilus]|uniref:2-dehydropantoate 2-reductase n=1 Tax=Caldinitratiruptor microaerophilus TaxID=671077 RepID=A0AA35CK05_9FIRM|nr:ketopantoate reductase family protein [Caldinitratiruptor microaerophilus]BDG60532.1 2-dehydropantoate 2-reductase [Caldinitratiruptor microaerophilus]